MPSTIDNFDAGGAEQEAVEDREEGGVREILDHLPVAYKPQLILLLLILR